MQYPEKGDRIKKTSFKQIISSDGKYHSAEQKCTEANMQQQSQPYIDICRIWLSQEKGLQDSSILKDASTLFRLLILQM